MDFIHAAAASVWKMKEYQHATMISVCARVLSNHIRHQMTLMNRLKGREKKIMRRKEDLDRELIKAEHKIKKRKIKKQMKKVNRKFKERIA